LVFQSNERGSGSLGYGKAKSPNQAITNATRDSWKKMQTIYRYEDRTIPDEIRVKFSGTKLKLIPKTRNTGITPITELGLLAQSFGFKDLVIRRSGRKHLRHTYMAWFKAMDKIWSPSEWARSTGQKYINKTKIWHPPSYFENKKYKESLEKNKITRKSMSWD